MIGVLKRNKLFDTFDWIGAQEMPALDADVHGEDTCDIPEALDFELCLDDWWPWFTADDQI